MTSKSDDGVAATTVEYRAGHYAGDWSLYFNEDDPTTLWMSPTDRAQVGVIRDINIARNALANHDSMTLVVREHRLKNVTIGDVPAFETPPTGTIMVCGPSNSGGSPPIGADGRYYRVNDDGACSSGGQQPVTVPATTRYLICTDADGDTIAPAGFGSAGDAIAGATCAEPGEAWKESDPVPTLPPVFVGHVGTRTTTVNSYREHTFEFTLDENTCRE